MKEELKESFQEYNNRYGEGCDFVNTFDHSYGSFMGCGLFCWRNRYKGLTYANSNEDGEIDLMIICRGRETIIRTTKDDPNFSIYDAEEEYKRDNTPGFLVPPYAELTELVVALAKGNPKTTNEEFDWLIMQYLIPGDHIKDGGREYMDKHGHELPPEFREHIRKMPYKDFLRTPYWCIIRDKVLSTRHYCQICGSSGYLEIHHSTYEIHGDEINNLDKLTVLCPKCHELFHKQNKLK